MESVSEILSQAQELGFLGERPITEVVEHAALFLPAVAGCVGVVADIGSGGGVPGLVLAGLRDDLRLVLIDRRQSRADHLQRAVRRLGWSDRVAVRCLDVDDIDSTSDLWGSCEAVVARGFGPPSVTLSAARKLLKIRGTLAVSEPPVPDPDRWPATLLHQLGFSSPQHLPGIAMFHVEH